MTNSGNKRPQPGDMVVLVGLPPGMLNDLPQEDQQAIKDAVGNPILFTEFDDTGRAELEFRDRDGRLHYIFVTSEFIRAANE